MKVGTDGVLLGAWSSLEGRPNSILDIGAGTGLIALMLAQRCGAETIDAIEIDENAHAQCVTNFEASPWGDRLFCYHAGLDEFVAEFDEPFDLIVSNPPFYSEAAPSGDKARDTARHNQSLPFDELLEGVSKLLAPNGLFTTVVPYREERAFLALAEEAGLFPYRILRVKGNPNTEIKRSLLEFGFQKRSVDTDELTIETQRHRYTPEYIGHTQAFYLKM